VSAVFCRGRLYDLFGQIEREFEILYADNVACKCILIDTCINNSCLTNKEALKTWLNTCNINANVVPMMRLILLKFYNVPFSNRNTVYNVE